MTWLARRSVRLFLLLALAAGTALSLAFVGLGSTEAGATTQQQQRIVAAAASNGFRVTVRAIRVPEPGNEPDSATVKIAAFKRSAGTWHRLGRPLIVGTQAGWFWNVVTRAYGVRQLTLARPGGRYPERIALKVLISPSIGPSATYRFVTDQGRLVQVDV